MYAVARGPRPRSSLYTGFTSHGDLWSTSADVRRVGRGILIGDGPGSGAGFGRGGGESEDDGLRQQLRQQLRLKARG